MTQLKNSVTGGGYDPGDPGPAWDEFNLEQQATIVERWFRGGMSATDRWYGYIEGNLRIGKA